MIHALIYARREGSYGFYESTPGFPAEYRDAIAAVCSNADVVAIPEAYRTALRYAPLYRKYLLTVIFRNVAGNQDEQIYHWTYANYLMDAADADRFFRLPFQTARQNAIQVSRKLLEDFRGCMLPTNLGQYLFQPGGSARQAVSRIHPASLMAGALYGRARPLESQLFIQVPDRPDNEIQALLELLPPRLRREVSFHTCVLFSRETRGVAICCCPAPFLDRIQASSFGGCEMTQKYYHFYPPVHGADRPDKRNPALTAQLLKLPATLPLYPFLEQAIPSWEVLLALAEAADRRAPLRQALRIIPEDDLLALVPETQLLSLKNLKLLRGASPHGSLLRKALSARIRERSGGFLGGIRLRLQQLPGGGIPRGVQLLLALAAAIGALLPAAADIGNIPALFRFGSCGILAFTAGFLLRGLMQPPPES